MALQILPNVGKCFSSKTHQAMMQHHKCYIGQCANTMLVISAPGKQPIDHKMVNESNLRITKLDLKR